MFIGIRLSQGLLSDRPDTLRGVPQESPWSAGSGLNGTIREHGDS
jgi:hypothetical protein